MSLVTNTEYKSLYDIVDNRQDTKLTLMLDYAEALVDLYCGRTMQEATYTEAFDGGADTVAISNYPITSIITVLINGTASAEYTLYDGFRIVYGTVQHSSILSRKVFPNGMQNIVVNYTAGYTPITLPSDLRLAILKLARTVNADKNMSVNNLKRQSLHGEDRQFNQPIGLQDYISDDIRSILNNYKSWF